MERHYPSIHQLNKQFCFLSHLEEHNRILIELNDTILLIAAENSVLPQYEELTDLLRSRYGGTSANWRLTWTQQGYLLKAPDWLFPVEIPNDAEYWEQNHRILVQPWQCLDASYILSPPTRVQVTIRDFALDYWHPFYFRQATAGMGTTAGVVHEGLRGDDKFSVKLLIDCYDLNHIAFKLYAGHMGRWTKCPVELEGRKNSSSRAPPSPSSDHN